MCRFRVLELKFPFSPPSTSHHAATSTHCQQIATTCHRQNDLTTRIVSSYGDNMSSWQIMKGKIAFCVISSGVHHCWWEFLEPKCYSKKNNGDDILTSLTTIRHWCSWSFGSRGCGKYLGRQSIGDDTCH